MSDEEEKGHGILGSRTLVDVHVHHDSGNRRTTKDSVQAFHRNREEVEEARQVRP